MSSKLRCNTSKDTNIIAHKIRTTVTDSENVNDISNNIDTTIRGNSTCGNNRINTRVKKLLLNQLVGKWVET